MNKTIFKNRKNKTKGFTLLELMMVLAVVGIVMAMGAPSFNKLIEKNTVKKASSDLTMTMLLARSEAVKRNQTVLVEPLNGTWTDGWSVSSGVEVISTFDTAEGVNIDGPLSVTFAGNGRIQELNVITRFGLKHTGSDAALRCLYLSASGKSKVLVDKDNDDNCANG
jgi:type IV fimbrial biogenesis protein FimT